MKLWGMGTSRLIPKTVCGNKFLSVGLEYRTPKENNAVGVDLGNIDLAMSPNIGAAAVLLIEEE